MKKLVIVLFAILSLCQISFSATPKNPKFEGIISMMKNHELDDNATMLDLGLNENEYKDFYLYVVVRIEEERLTYSEIPSNILNKMLQYCFSSIKFNNVSFGAYHTPIKNTTGFEKYNGLVEHTDGNGNIYTYAVAYRSEDKDIKFYSNRELANTDRDSYVSTSWGEYILVQQAHMNMIYYEQKHIPLEKWIKTNISIGELTMPNNYFIRDNNIFLSYSKVHGEIDDIIYTRPQYVVMAGQLIEVNSGVHPQVSSHWTGSLSRINRNTMTMDKSVTFEGIGKSTLLSSTEHLFVYDGDSKYMSSINSPVYILDYDLNIINMICPLEGDYYSDIIETKDYFIFCGHSDKSGYVGYDNPLIVVIDKSTHKEIVRKVYPEKDISFEYLYLLSANEILVQTKTDDYRVLRLSDLIPEKYQSNSLKKLSRLSKLSVVQEHPSKDICIYKSFENGKYGLTRKTKLSDFYSEPIYDSCEMNPRCIVASMNGQKALLNFYGREFVFFGEYAEIIDRLGYFEVHDEHGKVGILDGIGSCICKPKYEAVSFLCDIDEYVKLFHVVDDKENSGLIDSRGREIAPLIYQDFRLIPNTQSIVTYNYKGEQGLMDVTGATIFEPNFKDISDSIYDVNGLLVSTDNYLTVLDKENKTGLIDISGRYIIQPQDLQSLSVFPESKLFLAKSDEGYSMYSKTGTLLGSGYSSIYEIEHGSCFIVNDANGLSGMIDPNGKVIIPPLYDKLVLSRNKLILAVKGTKCGVFDYSGEEIAPVKFKYDQDASYVVLYYNKEKYAVMCFDDIQDNKLIKTGYNQTGSLSELVDHTFIVLRNNK